MDEQRSKELELIEQLVGNVTAEAQKIGLYLTGEIQIAQQTNAYNEVANIVICTYTIGDVAWSERVQNPGEDAIESEVRKMAVEIEDMEFGEAARRAEEQFGDQ